MLPLHCFAPEAHPVYGGTWLGQVHVFVAKSHVFGVAQSVLEMHSTQAAVVDGALPVCLHFGVEPVQGTLLLQDGGTVAVQKSFVSLLQMDELPEVPAGLVHCVA